ncbi:hypothetical protein LEP1GSC005_0049 [Leptospira santarosai str. ST188]|nr:hypothetical protein LEP1GSC005_0049 [Leptospira santarosai str. ST188]
MKPTSKFVFKAFVSDIRKNIFPPIRVKLEKNFTKPVSLTRNPFYISFVISLEVQYDETR